LNEPVGVLAFDLGMQVPQADAPSESVQPDERRESLAQGSAAASHR